MPLTDKTHYIFDMDGALTRAVHDFDLMRTQLDLPPGRPILESIAACPANEQDALHKKLHTIEVHYAQQAKPQTHADTLLKRLCDAGHSLGILTRNDRELAELTLATCGLLDYFDTDHILGRDCSPPKPSPHGIQALLQAWRADRQHAVIVGDYKFDLEAGRAAGVTTVHLAVTDDFA